jgi:hypothetical protein
VLETIRFLLSSEVKFLKIKSRILMAFPLITLKKTGLLYIKVFAVSNPAIPCCLFLLGWWGFFCVSRALFSLYEKYNTDYSVVSIGYEAKRKALSIAALPLVHSAAIIPHYVRGCHLAHLAQVGRASAHLLCETPTSALKFMSVAKKF